MTSVHIATDADRITWEQYANKNPLPHHALLWPWRGIVAECFGHQPHYLIARRAAASGEDEVVGILPLFFVSSLLFGRALISVPYLNGGGVLADDKQAYDALVVHANELAQSLRVGYVELRHRESSPYTPSSFVERSHKHAMLLPLAADPEELFQSFPAKLRSQIRRPSKSGVIAEISGVSRTREESVRAFYNVFSRNMRDLGTPVYPEKLFSKTSRAFADKARIITVWHENTPVAAGLTIRTRDSVEIPWASSLRQHNKLSANMLLYWAAIKQACLDSGPVFDFGRSSPDSGTYRFKAQWGANPLPLHWYYGLQKGEMPDVNPSSPKFRFAVQCWQRLPVSVANLIGPWLTKSLP